MKLIYMQRTIYLILTTTPDKIKEVEAIGEPEVIKDEDPKNNYFKFTV